jgi:hypothetical protein
MARKKRSLLAALRTPTKDRKRIAADEKVALELSDRERDLIMKHAFAGDELTDRLRILPRPGEPPAYRFTLDELDELAGYVAAEANHSKVKKLEEELRRLYARFSATTRTRSFFTITRPRCFPSCVTSIAMATDVMANRRNTTAPSRSLRARPSAECEVR